MHLKYSLVKTAAALALCGVAGQAAAVSIAVPNADFEATALGNSAIAAGDFAPGWAFVGGTHGVYNPSTAFYNNPQITDPPNAGVIGTMSGDTVAFFFSTVNSHMTATTAHDVVAGETYALTVSVGWRDNGNSLGATYIALFDGDSQLARHNVTAAELQLGTFTDVSLSYTTTAADSGKLRVRLGHDSGNFSDFDNVRLSVSAVPEPASWALMAGGAGLLLALRRRLRPA